MIETILKIGDIDYLEQFMEQYDIWFHEEGIFEATPIIESFIHGEYRFIINRNTDENVADEYIGFIIMGPYNCVEFIWIKHMYRNKGYGKKAVQLIEAKYYDFAINNSKGFWDKINVPSAYVLVIDDGIKKTYAYTDEIQKEKEMYRAHIKNLLSRGE